MYTKSRIIKNIPMNPFSRMPHFHLWKFSWFFAVLLGAFLILMFGWYVSSLPDVAVQTNTNTANVNTATANINNTVAVTNINTNTAPMTVPANQTDYTGWKTTTYQRADHGLTFQTPPTWSIGDGNMGQKESETLVSGSYRDDNGTYVSVNITFYNNASPLDQWITDHRQAITRHEDDWEQIITQSTLTINNEDVPAMTVTERYIGQNAPSSAPSRTVYYYFLHDTRVYEIAVSGDTALADALQPTIKHILETFTFITPKPVITIQAETSKKDVGVKNAPALAVDWLAAPETLNIQDPIFDIHNENGMVPYARAFYKAGTVTNGIYKNDAIVDILETPEGPAFGLTLYRAVLDPTTKHYTYLEKYSSTLEYLPGNFHYDSTATIPDMALPTSIAVPNTGHTIEQETYQYNWPFVQYASLEKVFTDAKAGQIYYDEASHCFIAKTLDGIAVSYHYSLSFANTAASKEAFESARVVPKVTWTGGTSVTAEYTYNEPTGGCGSSYCQALYNAEDIGGATSLKQVGTTNNGDPIYAYRDNNDQHLKDIYQSYAVPAQDQKKTYEQFVADHAIFYWEDPFGRYLRFRKYDFLPAVECGKPVIYLYPTKATNVNVQVQPTGGLTVTEPAYGNNGWTVLAKPDGTLTAKNGTTYPYLFWEGRGINYAAPQQGFVVARNNVGAFLDSKLAVLGLNEKERADFKEFWQPRLEKSPFVFVTFVSKQDFDRIAPLTVTPKPDSVIRVFMDYRPLEKPMTVQPQQLATPVRTGFTVVEWGGALHQ